MKGSAQRERWRRLGELLAATLEREPADRDAFLDDACGGDAALRREVASLMKAHSRPGAVDRLAEDVAPLTERLRKPAPSLAGRSVGRYQVHERMGGGGMGVVYRATDTRAGATVAFKVLKPSLDGDATAPARFRLEARAVSALDHPNICTVHEIGETDDGRLFIAMPLYEGETLNLRIARGPVPTAEAVAIAVQMARALANVHAQGIIHRDIKPSNVMVMGDGLVKLLDFGIAKLAGLTLTNSLAGPLGTIGYMSPEQLRGDPVDHRTDIWSLGVVLYEMLAGHRPFRGAAGVVVNAIVHGDPEPLIRLRPDIPDSVSRVANSALLKLPDARCASAEEFAGALLAAQP